MTILLSSIGSRGDVQPLLALALELQALGEDARLCVPPNFKPWVESFGLTCFPIGPDLKQWMAQPAPSPPVKPSAEQLRALAAHTVRTQFPVIAEAARGCDLVVGATALQFATRSIAESLGIPYVFAAYCPAVFPSPDHPPPKIPEHHPQGLPPNENLALWAAEDERWNDLFRVAINEGRAGLGLTPIDDVRRHLFTATPLLAADPVLGPPGATLRGMQIRPTGAWLYSDSSALPEPLERFLADGEPPVYLGFGSMRAADNTGPMLIEAARALGLRSIVSRGWGNVAAIDGASDCLAIDDVSHEKLFPRVAAVVHHGGAGTTTRAARAGAAQVIVPHNYDQYYWGHRVQQLGIGASGVDREHLSVEALVQALSEALRPELRGRATHLASRIQPDGARVAANYLVGCSSLAPEAR